ncbi:hypothetical protein HMPREF2541_01715 [Eikenella sp. HMSC061C02]|nr:hypothetical protein HMPREF2541_01715 [Eikenella sp. HMSC061C02]OWP27428.1 hypothetical protein CA838_03920 [Eikenella corrodens]
MRQSAAAWAALDEPTKERMLVSASDYLDANFRLKNGLNAAMRSGEKPVPPQVLKAVCELALQQQLNSNEKPRQQSVKVGEIAVTYAIGNTNKERFDYVAALLYGMYEPRKGVHMVPMPRG